MSLPCPDCGARTYVYGADSNVKTDTSNGEVAAHTRYRKCKACGFRGVSVEIFRDKLQYNGSGEPWYMEGAF